MVARTKWKSACFAGPSFHDGSGPACAAAGPSVAEAAGSAARPASTARRLSAGEHIFHSSFMADLSLILDPARGAALVADEIQDAVGRDGAVDDRRAEISLAPGLAEVGEEKEDDEALLQRAEQHG